MFLCRLPKAVMVRFLVRDRWLAKSWRTWCVVVDCAFPPWTIDPHGRHPFPFHSRRPSLSDNPHPSIIHCLSNHRLLSYNIQLLSPNLPFATIFHTSDCHRLTRYIATICATGSWDFRPISHEVCAIACVVVEASSANRSLTMSLPLIDARQS